MGVAERCIRRRIRLRGRRRRRQAADRVTTAHPGDGGRPIIGQACSTSRTAGWEASPAAVLVGCRQRPDLRGPAVGRSGRAAHRRSRRWSWPGCSPASPQAGFVAVRATARSPSSVDPVERHALVYGVVVVTAGLFSEPRPLPAGTLGSCIDGATRWAADPASIWRPGPAPRRSTSAVGTPTDVGGDRRAISAATVISGGAAGRSCSAVEQTAALVSAVPGAEWIEYSDTGHLVRRGAAVPTRPATSLAFLDDLADGPWGSRPARDFR